MTQNTQRETKLNLGILIGDARSPGYDHPVDYSQSLDYDNLLNGDQAVDPLHSIDSQEWWKGRVPDAKVADGGDYREFAEAALAAAAEILELKTNYEIVFVDSLPETTGLGLNIFNMETMKDSVILINQSILDNAKGAAAGTGAKIGTIAMIAFHEARHIKQSETICQYLRIQYAARSIGYTYQAVKKEIERSCGVKIEEDQRRIKKWIAEQTNYESGCSPNYLAQDVEIDARAFENVLFKEMMGIEHVLSPTEKRRFEEMTRRYGEKAKKSMADLRQLSIEVFTKIEQKKAEETAEAERKKNC